MFAIICRRPTWQILDRINTKVVHTLQLNQWKNTKAVLNWFNSIQCKAPCSFITFDVVDFYPSISIDLLNAALDFASQHVYISNDDRHIILQAKTSLLYSNGELWAKKTSSNLFDITMGSYDGAESCELVGAYLLYLIRVILVCTEMMVSESPKQLPDKQI